MADNHDNATVNRKGLAPKLSGAETDVLRGDGTYGASPTPDPLLLGNGSASAPTYSFSSDTDTGIYRKGSNQLGLALGGRSVVITVSSLVGPPATTTTADGGDFTVIAGAGGSVSGNGGILTFQGGQATTDGNGGLCRFVGGAAAGTDRNGGGFSGFGGNGLGTGSGGSVSLVSGAGGTSGDSGNFDIATADSAQNSGNINLTTGAAGGIFGDINFLVNAASPVFRINGTTQHTSHSGTSPTITAGGGTSPSIVGKDEAFIVTIGTGGIATSVEVTFANAFTNAPAANAQSDTDIVAFKVVALTTKVTITATAPFTAGSKISVICRGYE